MTDRLKLPDARTLFYPDKCIQRFRDETWANPPHGSKQIINNT